MFRPGAWQTFVLERASDPGLSDRCRERARRYDWSVVGPRFLELYERVA